MIYIYIYECVYINMMIAQNKIRQLNIIVQLSMIKKYRLF